VAPKRTVQSIDIHPSTPLRKNDIVLCCRIETGVLLGGETDASRLLVTFKRLRPVILTSVNRQSVKTYSNSMVRGPLVNSRGDEGNDIAMVPPSGHGPVAIRRPSAVVEN
jgi:hypothetical protein